MVSLTSLLITGTLVLGTLAHADPALTLVRRADPVCGDGNSLPAPGIRQPANGSTITWTAAEQANFEGHAIEIVYCSGEYFKTRSVNATVLLGRTTTPAGGIGPTGEILGSATPTGGAAPGGFYGYVFNVTVWPSNGDFRTGQYDLSVFEWATGERAPFDTVTMLMTCTGYYNPYNYHIYSVTVNFEKAPTT